MREHTDYPGVTGAKAGGKKEGCRRRIQEGWGDVGDVIEARTELRPRSGEKSPAHFIFILPSFSTRLKPCVGAFRTDGVPEVSIHSQMA